jgi:N-acetyl-gamma-glutamyl-phosphate reductase
MHNYLAKIAPFKDPSTPSKTASVVGARGYSGLELVKLLLSHPAVQLTHCFATQNFQLSDDLLNAGIEKVNCLPETQIMDNLTDVVFLATPAEVSLKLAPTILAAGKVVIDLSGAFRLKKNDYQKWYHFEHSEKALLSQAEYGLSPFCGPHKKSDAKLIANPGCFATAISMAIIPLLKRNLLDPESIVIDAKSGTTGAGRKASENLLFSEVAGECLPYRIGKHQHFPEIQETIENFSGIKVNPHFATHLLATPRGIIASIYAQAKTTDIKMIERAFTEEFFSYPLVRHGAQVSKLASLKKVVGTPFTHISYELSGNKLYLFSCIDNLLKGAASQAIENLNRYLDLPVGFGLTANSASNNGEVN